MGVVYKSKKGRIGICWTLEKKRMAWWIILGLQLIQEETDGVWLNRHEKLVKKLELKNRMFEFYELQTF